MAKIIQDYENCIGCGTCVALCPKFWEMDDACKARPKLGKKNPETGSYEFEAEKDKIGCNKDAADSCPAAVIKIF